MVAVSLRARNPSRSAGIRICVPLWLCIGALLCGCAELPPASPRAPQPSSAHHPSFEIGVLIAAWHTGLILPAGELGPLHSLLEDDPHAKYLSIGWGNRRFYMAAYPGSGDAISALFPSPSVVFAQALSIPSDLLATNAQIRWICADRDELLRVARYIESSLSRPGGKLVRLGAGPVPESRFYASRDHYSAVHTCNTWTVAALQYARLPVRADGVIFVGQASRRIRGLRACPAP
jgi:hypothetical protein